jgi:hypothetical protein
MLGFSCTCLLGMFGVECALCHEQHAALQTLALGEEMYTCRLVRKTQEVTQ